MITKLLIASIFGFLSCAAIAGDDAVSDGVSATMDGELLMAANPRKDRRDNRQEDRQGDRDGRQDCRQEEGAIGDDKRECKQEERHEDGDDDGAEADEKEDA